MSTNQWDCKEHGPYTVTGTAANCPECERQRRAPTVPASQAAPGLRVEQYMGNWWVFEGDRALALVPRKEDAERLANGAAGSPAGLDQQTKEDLETLEGAIYTTSPEMHDCAQPALDRLRAALAVGPARLDLSKLRNFMAIVARNKDAPPVEDEDMIDAADDWIRVIDSEIRALASTPSNTASMDDAVSMSLGLYSQIQGALVVAKDHIKDADGGLVARTLDRMREKSTPSNTGAAGLAEVVHEVLEEWKEYRGDATTLGRLTRAMDKLRKAHLLHYAALAAGNTGTAPQVAPDVLVKLAREVADTFCEWNQSEDQVLDGETLNALHELYDAFYNPADGIPLVAAGNTGGTEGEDGSAGAPPTPVASPSVRICLESLRVNLFCAREKSNVDHPEWHNITYACVALARLESFLGRPQDEAPAESASEANPSNPDPYFLYREENRHLTNTKAPNAPRLTLDRPAFDGADIMRMNHLAEEFPQYEQSTRWKSLWPFIAWALEVQPVPRDEPEAQAPAEPRLECWMLIYPNGTPATKVSGITVKPGLTPDQAEAGFRWVRMVEAPGENK